MMFETRLVFCFMVAGVRAGQERDTRHFSGGKAMLYILIGMYIIHMYAFLRTDQTVHLRSVHFTVCKLYLNY